VLSINQYVAASGDQMPVARFAGGEWHSCGPRAVSKKRSGFPLNVARSESGNAIFLSCRFVRKPVVTVRGFLATFRMNLPRVLDHAAAAVPSSSLSRGGAGVPPRVPNQ
jgi:hypothetical protein